MDEIIYNALKSYYNYLGKVGYTEECLSNKLLILAFYRDFMLKDYRGLLNKNDYHLIEVALNGVYGSECLIPYPDYLKMGKLHLGEMTEMAHRVKILENTDVVKLIHNLENAEDSLDYDIKVVAEED